MAAVRLSTCERSYFGLAAMMAGVIESEDAQVTEREEKTTPDFAFHANVLVAR